MLVYIKVKDHAKIAAVVNKLTENRVAISQNQVPEDHQYVLLTEYKTSIFQQENPSEEDVRLCKFLIHKF